MHSGRSSGTTVICFLTSMQMAANCVFNVPQAIRHSTAQASAMFLSAWALDLAVAVSARQAAERSPYDVPGPLLHATPPNSFRAGSCAVPGDMELPSNIEPQAEQQGRDQTPKDKIEDKSKNGCVIAPVKRTVRFGYLLFLSNQLAEPRCKNDQRSDPNPKLRQYGIPDGHHRFPRSFPSCGSQPRNQISIGRDNDTQLSKPTAAAWRQLRYVMVKAQLCVS